MTDKLTKETAENQIRLVLQEKETVNPAVITQKLGWNKEKINEICTLFGVEKFTDVLEKISGIKIIKDENGTKYARLEKTESKTEETMASDTNIHDRIKKLRDALSDGLYEKEEAVRLSLLAAVAGESVFFLGAPGCAKSMIARRIAQAFKADGDTDEKVTGGGIHYFETLLNQFSTPEDVFGNISLKALNGELEENGNKEEYRRLTENMLPEADIAFLDEIWKASPAILNSLLTIINERKFHNGSTVKDVPLKTLFTASNELPAKGKGLEALYDRLILRLRVGFIKDEEKFFDMIESPSKPEFKIPDGVEPITKKELEEWSREIDKVTLSEKARSVITAIRKEMSARNEKMSDEEKANGEQFEVGDRRWKKIARILKTSAFLNGRTEADLMDCQLIEHCIWSTEKQRANAREIVEQCIKENGLDCDTAIDDINEQIEEFDKYIDGQFYTLNPARPKIYKSQDRHNVYKIVNPVKIHSYGQIEPTYLCETYVHQNYGRKGAYYDSNGKIIGDYNYYFVDGTFKIKGNIAEWTDGHSRQSYSVEIEMIPDELVKDPKVFETPDLLELRQKKADSEKYDVIKKHIESELKQLDDFVARESAPFKANLFADQYICDVIMSAISKAKEDLQDAMVNLDKERHWYQS